MSNVTEMSLFAICDYSLSLPLIDTQLHLTQQQTLNDVSTALIKVIDSVERRDSLLSWPREVLVSAQNLPVPFWVTHELIHLLGPSLRSLKLKIQAKM